MKSFKQFIIIKEAQIQQAQGWKDAGRPVGPPDPGPIGPAGLGHGDELLVPDFTVPPGGAFLSWMIFGKIEQFIKDQFPFLLRPNERLDIQALMDRYGASSLWELLQILLGMVQDGQFPLLGPYLDNITDLLQQLLEELLREPAWTDTDGDIQNAIDLLRELLKKLKDMMHGGGGGITDSDGMTYRYGSDGYWYDEQGRRYKKVGNDFIPADPVGDPDYVSPSGFPNPYA